MSKKLITACMALVALTAFGLPTAASASPEITHPTGTTIATGSLFKGTNVGVTKMTNSGGAVLWECSVASMTGKVTKNNGTEIEADITSVSITGTASEGRCTSSFGNLNFTTAVENGVPWCLRATKAMEPDEFQVSGGNCGTNRKIRFILDSSTAGECKYSRSEAIRGTFLTDPSDAQITMAKVLFKGEAGNSFLCPAEGSFDMSFTLETDTATAEPLYIS
jgi:hypothetical protein